MFSLKSTLIAASFCAAVIAATHSAASTEAVHWNGAGWYGIEDVVEWGWIISGLYADKASCEAPLPADDDESEFCCQYLAEKPAWD